MLMCALYNTPSLPPHFPSCLSLPPLSLSLHTLSLPLPPQMDFLQKQLQGVSLFHRSTRPEVTSGRGPSRQMSMSLTNKGLLNPTGHNNCFLNSCVQVIQWNLRTKDTLGLIVLSLVERLSLSRRYNNTLNY